MSGNGRGVHGRIKELIPTADYFWCASHKLNLVATYAAANVTMARVLRCLKEVSLVAY